jgi:hypothetical protein
MTRKIPGRWQLHPPGYFNSESLVFRVTFENPSFYGRDPHVWYVRVKSRGTARARKCWLTRLMNSPGPGFASKPIEVEWIG